MSEHDDLGEDFRLEYDDASDAVLHDLVTNSTCRLAVSTFTSCTHNKLSCCRHTARRFVVSVKLIRNDTVE